MRQRRRAPSTDRLPGHPEREYTTAHLRPWSRRYPFAFVTTVLLVLVLATTVVFVPRLVLSWDIAGRALPADQARAINDIRSGILQGLAGLGLLVGAVFTWWQLQVTRQGQVAERFSTAVAHLGHDNLDVRLGGIYALEIIARTSAADRNIVTDLLSAYVVRHGQATETQREQWMQARHAADDQARRRHSGEPAGEPLSTTAPDLHAAIKVLARRQPKSTDVLHLSRLSIAGGRLQYARFARADLHSSDLRSVDFTGADLRSADLAKSNISYANLRYADLTDADLRAVLGLYVRLDGAVLRRADLAGADLSYAMLQHAQLDHADLRGARLKEADLSYAVLSGAYCDDDTEWPTDFNWRAAGARVDATAPPPRPTDWLHRPPPIS
jgi:hypothetical protein